MSGLTVGGSTWREQNAAWLAASLVALRLRLHRHALTIRTAAGQGVADWLVARDAAHDVNARELRSTELGALDARIADADGEAERLQGVMFDEGAPPALRILGELAGLSPLEERVLLMAAAPSLDGAFAPAYAELHADGRRDHATLHLGLALFAEPHDRLLAADCLMPTRPLRRLRLLDVSVEPVTSLVLRGLTVDERVADYLRGYNRPDVALEPHLSPVSEAVGSAGTLTVAADIVSLMEREPGRWRSINLVGPADAGANDAILLACRRLRLRPSLLRIAPLLATGRERRAEIVALLGREALLGDLALILDATTIERGSEAAALVDDLVMSLAAPLFAISDERWPAATGQLDVLHVPRPTRKDQRALWHTALAVHPNTVNGAVDAIVQQFDLGPAAIADVVANAARRTDESITGPALWDACRDRSGAALDDLARRIEPVYAWDDIVVADDVRDLLRELAAQVENRGRVYEHWGFGAQLGRGRGITALFAGPSGTGKTMAAEIVAGHLRLDLRRIDLAGIVSKYIGETEKNLRRVFDAAESSGAILLFDEADALFGTRTDVRDSHDRYANLEIDYLLQRMEDYTGLAILATNRRAALDGAFLRRLRFVVEFPFPAADDRRRIWERVFPADAALDGIDHGLLSRLELSGGNIRSIALNAAFLAAAAEQPIGMAHVMRAAAREYAKLAKPISAAEFGRWVTVARA